MNELQELYHLLIQEKASEEQHARFLRLLAIPEHETEARKLLEQLGLTIVAGHIAPRRIAPEHLEMIRESILAAGDPTPRSSSRGSHRVHFLRRGFFRYAAAIVLTIGAGIGAYFWTTDSLSKKRTLSAVASAKADIAPGGNKAMLTLSDGTTIALDSAADGAIAQQGNSSIVKLSNGEVAYKPLSAFAEATADAVMNTMSTPNGGQYQLILPDGTKVWLNAASSITYPAVFVGTKRNVKVTGEAYFEVAKNKANPFMVDVDGKSLIEVLGTDFNVNSYASEASITTTLLQGSVKVSRADQNAVLKPGQQAKILMTAVAGSSDRQLNASGTGDKQIVINPNPDIEQALAWKNGLFNFNSADLRSVMRQLERWYDIKVQYQGSVPDISLKGKMYRNVNLSTVLNFLQKLGVKLRMEGKTVIVL